MFTKRENTGAIQCQAQGKEADKHGYLRTAGRKTCLYAPVPEVELLLMLAGQVQCPQLFIFLLVQQGEGPASMGRHGVPFKDLCGLSSYDLHTLKQEMNAEHAMCV